MANRITVQIEAKDLASTKIKDLARLIDGLESKSSRAGSAGATGFKAMAGAVALGNIAAQTLTASIGAVGSAVGGMAAKFSEAAEIQQDIIKTAGGLMGPMKESYAGATKFVEDFNQRMATAAAELPGSTADYVNLGRALMDNLVPAFKEASGAIDKSGLNKSLDNIVSKAGTLAGSDFGNMSKAIQKGLSGNATLNQIKNLDVIGVNNPALYAALERQVEKFGDFNEVSIEVATKMWETALNEALPDEALKELTGSAGALIEGFKSKMFDPYTGIFGFYRDINLDTAGSQSVFKAMEQGLNTLLGKGGTLDIIGQGLNKLFGWTDTTLLENLRRNFLKINEWLKGFNGVLGKIVGGLKPGQIPQFDFSQLVRNSVGFIRDGIASGLDRLNSLDWGAIGVQVGQLIGGWINGIIAGGGGLAVNPAQIIELALKVGYGLINGIFAAVVTIDWTQVAFAAASLFGQILASPLSAFGSLFGDQWKGFTDGVALVINGNMEKLQGIGSTISGFFGTVGDVFIDLTNKAIGLLNSIPGIPDIAPMPVAAAVADQRSTFVGSRASGYFPDTNTGGILRAAATETAAMPSGASLAVANSSEAILTTSQQQSLAASLGSRRSAVSNPEFPNSTVQNSLSVGSIVVHSAATDASGIARDVMAEIEKAWVTFQKSRLSAVATS